jgi:heme/copper-type cytochrome/quinol oxidase subunit 2
MNLLNIIYEPYVIILIVALVITIFAYFIIRNNSNEDEDGEESKKRNIPKILLITFLASFILLYIGKYGIEYMNTKKFFQKGGVDVVEHLTIVADDLDYNIMES